MFWYVLRLFLGRRRPRRPELGLDELGKQLETRVTAGAEGEIDEHGVPIVASKANVRGHLEHRPGPGRQAQHDAAFAERFRRGPVAPLPAQRVADLDGPRVESDFAEPVRQFRSRPQRAFERPVTEGKVRDQVEGGTDPVRMVAVFAQARHDPRRTRQHHAPEADAAARIVAYGAQRHENAGVRRGEEYLP